MAYEDRFRPKGERIDSGVTSPKRIPKAGDQVLAKGHHGAFVVAGVDSARKTANLAKIGSPDLKLIVGWQDIDFIDELDESQNALRVVREATEDQ